MNSSTDSLRATISPRLALIIIPIACLAWTFWPTFVELAQVWQHNPQYTHGYLVPLFALGLLWLRRDQLDLSACAPNWLLGVPLLALGIGLRLWGAYFFYIWLDPLSILPTVAGLVCLLGGWPALRWSWPAVLFLGFMVPLPYRLATALSGPLQELATVVSTFLMQTIGLPALSEGNVIHLNEESIGVVEACSGLSMLMVFFALSTLVAVVSARRPLLERLVLVASAVPIALVSNILRITATGILHETSNSETAKAFFHDVAGWLMMPIGLGFLWVELKIMARLFLVKAEQPNRPGRPSAPPAPIRRALASDAGVAKPPRARQTPPPARDKARAARVARVTGAPRPVAPTPTPSASDPALPPPAPETSSVAAPGEPG
jgi:exosortase